MGIQIKCPKCGYLLRQSNLDTDCFFRYGKLLRKCPECKTEYYDKGYHELALEATLPGSKKEIKKKNRFKRHLYDAGDFEEEYRQSEMRLSDRSYKQRLIDNKYQLGNPKLYDISQNSSPKNVMEMYEFLEQRIGPVFPIFILNGTKGFLSRLVYSAKDAEAVKEVIRQVLKHYGVDEKTIKMEVTFLTDVSDSEENKKGTLGTFSHGIKPGGTIHIKLDPRYCEYDSVIAVVLHECAHAYLWSKMISYPDKLDNELLTDVAVIYLGGGHYMARGYYMFENVRIGYIYKHECNAIKEKVDRKRSLNEMQEYDRKQEMLALWETMVDRIDSNINCFSNLLEEIHPNRIIRHSLLIKEFEQELTNWAGKSQKLIDMIKLRFDDEINIKELKKAIDTVSAKEREFNKAFELIQEWTSAEQYQSSLPEELRRDAAGLINLADNDNVFAQLQMIRFWAPCTATVRDAKLYYDALRDKTEDKDCMYVAGVCLWEGLIQKQDEKEDISLLCLAASLGSKDAAKLLENAV